MNLLEIIKKSDNFSFMINSMELAQEVVKRLKKIGFQFLDQEMENIFIECPKNRAIKYRFELHPKEMTMSIQPNFGGTKTDWNSFVNPVFSQELIIFIMWVIKNEELIGEKIYDEKM